MKKAVCLAMALVWGVAAGVEEKPEPAEAGKQEIRLPAEAFKVVDASGSGELQDFLKLLKKVEKEYRVVGTLQTTHLWAVVLKSEKGTDYLLAQGRNRLQEGSEAVEETKTYYKRRGMEDLSGAVGVSCVSADGTYCYRHLGRPFKAVQPRIALEAHDGEAVSTLELEVGEEALAE